MLPCYPPRGAYGPLRRGETGDLAQVQEAHGQDVSKSTHRKGGVAGRMKGCTVFVGRLVYRSLKTGLSGMTSPSCEADLLNVGARTTRSRSSRSGRGEISDETTVLELEMLPENLIVGEGEVCRAGVRADVPPVRSRVKVVSVRKALRARGRGCLATRVKKSMRAKDSS